MKQDCEHLRALLEEKNEVIDALEDEIDKLLAANALLREEVLNNGGVIYDDLDDEFVSLDGVDADTSDEEAF